MKTTAPRIPTGTGWPGARAPHTRLADAWHEQTEWETDLAYYDGYAAGHAAANAEMVTAVGQALGGPGTKNYADGVRRHDLAVSQRAARAAADAHTDGPVG